MYTSIFEIFGLSGIQEYTFAGKDASDILFQLQCVQDLGCLVEMGSKMEDENGKKGLARIQNILDKDREGSLTIQDLKDLDVSLSIGSVKCVCVEERQLER